jgi:hypothetical protein
MLFVRSRRNAVTIPKKTRAASASTSPCANPNAIDVIATAGTAPSAPNSVIPAPR